MTDDELKALVASIAVNQAKTDEQIAKTDAQLALTDAQLAKTDAQLALTDAQLAKTDAQLALTDAQLAKTDAQLAKMGMQLANTDSQLGKTDQKFNKLAEMYGGLSHNIGYMAEETFLSALEKNPMLGDMQFDEVSTRWKKRTGKKEAEYDIVMLNGSAVGVIEVKYRLHPADVRKFAEQKLPLFKEIFPDYRDTRLYGAVASLSYSEGALDTAKEYGLFAITPDGQEIKLLNSEMTAY